MKGAIGRFAALPLSSQPARQAFQEGHRRRAQTESRPVTINTSLKSNDCRRSGVMESGKYASARPSAKVSSLCSKDAGTKFHIHAHPIHGQSYRFVVFD